MENGKEGALTMEQKFLVEIAAPEIQVRLSDLFFEHQIAVQSLQRELQMRERRPRRIHELAEQVREVVEQIVELLTF